MSTDCELGGAELYALYKARFQMEFLFRDAKQWTGLSQCQARDQQALHFHFNASLSAVNLAKIAQTQAQTQTQTEPFSLASWKQKAFNEHLLHLFIANLDLEPSWVITHPAYPSLCNYGAIAP